MGSRVVGAVATAITSIAILVLFGDLWGRGAHASTSREEARVATQDRIRTGLVTGTTATRELTGIFTCATDDALDPDQVIPRLLLLY